MQVPGGRLAVAQRGDATVLRFIPAHGPARSLRLPPQDGIYPHSFTGASRIGTAPGLVVLQTAYASRPGGPTHECGAGEETVLRVVTLRPLVQRLATTTESCWFNVEPGDVGWDGATRRLSVETTTSHTAGLTHVRTTYAVAPDGRVSIVGIDGLPD